MTDLEHPSIIRMIASFTGLDFGQIDLHSRKTSVSPNKYSQPLRLISKSHHKRHSTSQWNDNSSSEECSGSQGDQVNPESPTKKAPFRIKLDAANSSIQPAED